MKAHVVVKIQSGIDWRGVESEDVEVLGVGDTREAAVNLMKQDCGNLVFDEDIQRWQCDLTTSYRIEVREIAHQNTKRMLVVGRHPFKDEDYIWCHRDFDYIVFQATPWMVAVALANFKRMKVALSKIGFVSSKPGERLPTRVCTAHCGVANKTEVADLVKAVNPRARVVESAQDTVAVEVEPPMRFEFDKIEWL